VAVAIAEVQLSSKHPADYRSLDRFLANNSTSRDIEGDVAFMKHASQRRARIPQAKH
jgi:hypothetical protein